MSNPTPESLPLPLLQPEAVFDATLAPGATPTPTIASAQPRNPLHGLRLEVIVTALVAHYGWVELGARVPVRCFTSDPSMASSVKFLRKTPWAREKVEGLYLFMLRELRRTQSTRE